MDFKLENDYNELRIIYNQIIKGYTFDHSANLFVRHFKEEDVAGVLLYKHELKRQYQKSGLLSKEECLKRAIEMGEWDSEKDEKILELEYLIKDNERFVLSIVLESQRKEVEKILRDKRAELAILRMEKGRAIGYNSDDLSEKESSHLFIKSNLYKDEDLKIPVLGENEDLRDIEEVELDIYNGAIGRYISSISEDKIRAIACLPFFLNRYSPCKERPEAFFNRSMSELTNHQLSLLLSGGRNLSILSEADGEPPSLMDDITIEKLVNWYDQQYSQILSKREGGKGTITKTEKVVVNQGR